MFRGMFTFDSEGTITWANSQCMLAFLLHSNHFNVELKSTTQGTKSIDTFSGYEMTGHSRNVNERPMSFLGCVVEQDRDAFLTEWMNLTISKEEVSMEYVYISLLSLCFEDLPGEHARLPIVWACYI